LIVLFVVLLLSAGAKKVFVKDTVKVEKQFLKEKQESKQEAQKELEDLENLE
jgi:hypothetical protein